MRIPLILSLAALVSAACSDPPQAPVAPLPSSESTRSLADDIVLRIAIEDGLHRLLPDLSPDARAAVGDALRALDASLNPADPTSPGLAAALSRSDGVLGRFAALDRADRATLDALTLELSVSPRR